MQPELVFNELSLTAPAANVHKARTLVSNLVDLVLAARPHGLRPSVRAQSNLNELLVGPEYRIGQWRQDPAVDKERRQYFGSVISKSPLLVDLPAIQDMLHLQEFQFDEALALGLGVAYLIDGIGISFQSAEMWNASTIEVQRTELSDGEESLHIESVSVVHASTPQHIQLHAQWIRRRFTAEIVDGMDIWEKRSDAFASLDFCSSVEAHLSGVTTNDPLLHTILDRLEKLNAYRAGWNAGPFRPEDTRLNTRPESAATLQKYPEERTFRCPDGTDRLFSWHCSISDSHRLYYFPDASSRRIYIGYIGKHLSTVKFPK